MSFKIEQPILGAVGSEGIFQEFTSASEAQIHIDQIVRKLEHYVIVKHNTGQGKDLEVLEREVEEAKQLKVVLV